MKHSFFARFLLVCTLIGIAPMPAASAPKSVAVVVATEGTALVQRDGQTYRLIVGFPLYEGDTVQTSKSGKLRLSLADNSVLNIGPATKLSLSQFATTGSERSFSVDVLFGRFKMDIAKWFFGGTQGTITTPSAVVGVRGTVVWGDTELDAVCALEGTVELAPRSAIAASVTLNAGECVGGMAGGKTEPLAPTPEQVAGYLEQVTIR